MDEQTGQPMPTQPEPTQPIEQPMPTEQPTGSCTGSPRSGEPSTHPQREPTPQPQYIGNTPNGYVPPPSGYMPPPPSGYMPPPNYNPNGYNPNGYNPNGYHPYPVTGTPQKKGVSPVALGVVITVLVIVAIVLAIVIGTDSPAPEGAPPRTPQISSGLFESKKNDSPIDVVIEQVDRPKLADEQYVNKEAGLMNTEGVSDYILPSTVLVSVYADQYFYPLSYGSGVIMTANGYIITNAHVVADGLSYSCTLSDGEVYEAELIGMDSTQDVAVLKIEADGLTPATFGKTADVSIGEEIVILASSGEEIQSFATFGHISKTEIEIATAYSSSLTCFQTDAAVNSGTSGGPAVNMYGQVIGIVVAKHVDISSGVTPESIGFLLQVDNVVKTAEELIENGYVEGEVKLGIYYAPLDNVTAGYYDVPSGLFIYSVAEGSGAAACGILPNDIITEMDGKAVLSEDSIDDALDGKIAGDVIVVTVARKKITGDVETLTMNLTLQQKIDLPSNTSFTAAE